MYLLLLQGLTGFCNGLDSLVHVSLSRETVDHLVQCLRHGLGRLHRKGSSNSENHSSYNIRNNMHSTHTHTDIPTSYYSIPALVPYCLTLTTRYACTYCT